MVISKITLPKLVFTAVLLLLGSILLLHLKSKKEAYYLAVWPQKIDATTCTLLAVNTETTKHHSYNNSGCAYQIGKSEQKNTDFFHFRYENHETDLSLLEITRDKIEDTKQIILPMSRITSVMHWVDNDTILFSGIREVDSQEGVFFFNIQTELVIQTIVPNRWFYADPNLNNSGTYVSYSQYMSHSDSMIDSINSLQCTPHYYCNQHTYLIQNMIDNTMLDVQKLSSEHFDFPHNPCNGMWSPGGEYFAFQIGCLDSEGIMVINVSTNETLFTEKKRTSVMMWADEGTIVYFDHQTGDYFTHDLREKQTLRQNLLSNHNTFQDYWVNWFHFDLHDQLMIGYFVKPESNNSTSLSDMTSLPEITTVIIGDLKNETLSSLTINGRIIETPIWVSSQGIGVMLINTNTDTNTKPDLKFIKFDMEANILMEEKIQHDFPSANLHVALLMK